MLQPHLFIHTSTRLCEFFFFQGITFLRLWWVLFLPQVIIIPWLAAPNYFLGSDLWVLLHYPIEFMCIFCYKKYKIVWQLDVPNGKNHWIMMCPTGEPEKMLWRNHIHSHMQFNYFIIKGKKHQLLYLLQLITRYCLWWLL